MSMVIRSEKGCGVCFSEKRESVICLLPRKGTLVLRAELKEEGQQRHPVLRLWDREERGLFKNFQKGQRSGKNM